MFGKTAKQWQNKNPDLHKQGLNIRDVADIESLIVLSGLETINAYLINQGENKETRIERLTVEAQNNFAIIQNRKSVSELKEMTKKSANKS